MPKDKKISREKIIRAAIDEFTEYGYDKASMRRIGERCGLTAAALYRHFDSKAALFRTLVKPAIDDFNAWMDEHSARTAEEIRRSLDESGNGNISLSRDRIDIDMMKDLIYPRMDEYVLLVNKSAGSEYENFMSDLVDAHQKRLVPYINKLRERGCKVKDISVEDLHILLTVYFKALFEPVARGYSLEKAMKYLRIIDEFFGPGWMMLMGV